MPEAGAGVSMVGQCFAGKHMTVEAMVAQQTRIERCALGSHSLPRCLKLC